MSSKRIADLPVKNPIDAMKIPTGGFGDYAITLKILSDWLVNKYSLATKDELANLQVLLLEKIDEEFKKLDVYTKGETDLLIRNVKENLESEISKLSTRVSENKTRLDNLGTTSKYSVETLPTSKPTEDFVKKSISDLKLGSASQKDVEFFAEQEKRADKVILGNGRTVESKLKDYVSVKDYNPTLSGELVRLSSKYNTIEEAQQDYPTATSLDDTFDVVAIEKASLESSRVYLPAGKYSLNRTVLIQSNTEIYGDFDNTVLIPNGFTDNMHVIANSEGWYTWDKLTEEEKVNAVLNNKGNTNIFIRDLHINATGFPTYTGVCFKNVSYSDIQNVKVTKIGYHGFDVADATEGNISDATSSVFGNKPSHNVTIKKSKCFGHGDDGFTTHFSHDITIDKCVSAYGSATFKGSNGFEVDDGSSNVSVTDCIAYGEQAGFVAKCHGNKTDGAPAPRNSIFTRCVAIDCTYSHWAYGWQTEESGVFHPTAHNTTFNDCVSIRPRLLNSVNTRIPFALNIQGVSGVRVNNYKIYSHLAVLPYISDDFIVPEKVVIDGVDKTFTTPRLISLSSNAHNVVIDGLYLDSVDVSSAALRVEATAIDNITVKNVVSVKQKNGSVIGIASTYIGKVTIDNVYADTESTINQPVVDIGGKSNTWYQHEVNNINGFRGYVSAIKDETSTNLQRAKKFISRSGTGTAPVTSSISSSSGNLLSFKEFNDVEHSKIYLDAGNTQHLSKTGSYIYFGTFDPSTGLRTVNWGFHPDGSFYPNNGDVLSLGRNNRFINTTYTRKVNLKVSLSIEYGSGSPEGVKDAGIGSMYIDESTGEWYQKKTASGTLTGWVVK